MAGQTPFAGMTIWHFLSGYAKVSGQSEFLKGLMTCFNWEICQASIYSHARYLSPWAKRRVSILWPVTCQITPFRITDSWEILRFAQNDNFKDSRSGYQPDRFYFLSVTGNKGLIFSLHSKFYNDVGFVSLNPTYGLQMRSQPLPFVKGGWEGFFFMPLVLRRWKKSLINQPPSVTRRISIFLSDFDKCYVYYFTK